MRGKEGQRGDCMISDNLLGWIASPSRKARVLIKDGYLRNGLWQNGTVRMQLSGLPAVEVQGFIRPNEAVISDTGFAAIVDWLSLTGLKPRAELCFINPQGSVFRRHRFNMMIGRAAIEPQGVLMFLTTAASESQTPQVMCFDVRSGDRAWSEPAPGPFEEITVVPEEKCIHLGRPVQECGGEYIFKMTYDGKLVDRNPRTPYDAINCAESARRGGDYVAAERWFRLAAKCDIAPSYRATAYRALGEIAERDGRITDALNCFEKAISLYPKVGLKRKLALLKATGRN